MKQIITKQDDRIDCIAQREYGFCKGAVEAIYAANPGLASQTILLPEGTSIVMPDILAPQISQTRLWD